MSSSVRWSNSVREQPLGVDDGDRAPSSGEKNRRTATHAAYATRDEPVLSVMAVTKSERLFVVQHSMVGRLEDLDVLVVAAGHDRWTGVEPGDTALGQQAAGIDGPEGSCYDGTPASIHPRSGKRVPWGCSYSSAMA